MRASRGEIKIEEILKANGVNFAEEYLDRVFSEFLSEYKKGI